MLPAIVAFALGSQWGGWIFVAMCFALFIPFNIGMAMAFKSHMRLAGYPNQCKGSIFAPRSINRFLTDRRIGATWFARNLHYYMVFAAYFLLVAYSIRSIISHHALEFARSGSLVVVIGLVSITLGFREAKIIKKTWDKTLLDHVPLVDEKLNKLIVASSSIAVDDAQGFSFWMSFMITVLGTVVWAFGDQIFACGLFPAIYISDLSGVACFIPVSSGQPETH